MITLSSLGPFLSFFISFVVSIFILFSNSENKLNRTFFVLGMASCLYSFSQGFCRNSVKPEDFIFWSRISFVGAVLLPVIVLSFCREFFEAGTIRSAFVAPLYPVTLIMLYLNFTPAMFRDVDFTYGEPVVRAGWAMSVNSLIILLTFSYLIMRFRHDFRNSNDSDHRNRLKYLGLGAVIYLIAGGLDVLRRFDVLYLFTVPVADYATMLFMLILSYTIRRHKLLEIRTFIGKSIVISAMMTVMALTFIIVEEGLEFLISSMMAPGTQSIWPGVFAALTIALLFYPLRKFLDRFIRRWTMTGSGEFSGSLAQWPMDGKWWRCELVIPTGSSLTDEDRTGMKNLAQRLRRAANVRKKRSV
ncbi:MAG: hypothetical protein CVV64_12805 [Candidatus Wallbacteria bacterium HGW-Wallbacteria-1]|jgi:hypothetical protein|uniref:Histidine kinase N-terminal 7TM region domain-containing protein n=1 Tax=Candidatus Wallbacteria bacterium HGW-Wallbacteria-1 TaxID=2013854 RepID=A0A2N1PMW3_9BACT|nr:MAG: hypothetical protein CVV64_12805 [Candidatus Wallbacteria bacterium HGW-Wallbacteria-1]